MNGRIPVLYVATALIFAMLILSGCLATPIDDVDAALLGTWEGEASVRPPIRFEPVPAEEREPEVAVPLSITIHEDATVTGSVGGAQLADCVLKRNRSELGRQLNVASDYIVMDGYLDGPVIAGDEEPQKSFTLPFDVVDGRMQGSIMWLQELKYPSPLLRVDLTREAGS